ncbi:hypothetical protein [Bifidobacterium apicola]|uniref:hypothetical protein n=1 Tax=Bifidobacterium apicola TaxID=3230739 RepID=UPI0036F30544
MADELKVSYDELSKASRVLKNIEETIGDFTGAEADSDCMGDPSVISAYADCIARLHTLSRKYSRKAGDLGSMLDNVVKEFRDADDRIGDQAGQMLSSGSSAEAVHRD